MITLLALGLLELTARNFGFSDCWTAKGQKSPGTSVKLVGKPEFIAAEYTLAGRTGLCIFDTGCPITIFRAAVLQALGKPIGKERDDTFDADGPIVLNRALGDLHLANRDFDAAGTCWHRILNVAPDDLKARSSLAGLAFRRGQIIRGLTEYARSIREALVAVSEPPARGPSK